jgi:thioredoxin 1
MVRAVQDDRADPGRGVQTYDGKLRVAKMNVDENRDVPAKYGIRGIPTLVLFKNGELAATKVGALSKAQLTAFIDSHL